MNDEQNQGLGGKLADAYNSILKHSRDGLHKVEQEAGPVLHKLVDSAAEQASALGELTREEANKAGDYLKRDLISAAQFVSRSGKELVDWLRFDVTLIENALLERFSTMVDHTRQELDGLERRADAMGEWHSGEVTGIGTLECKACGEHLHFHHTAHIPPCPKCHGGKFRRISHSDVE